MGTRTRTSESIKYARKALGVSFRELGKRVRKSAAYLCDVEHGNRRASEELVAKVARALGATVAHVSASCPDCDGRGTIQEPVVQQK